MQAWFEERHKVGKIAHWYEVGPGRVVRWQGGAGSGERWVRGDASRLDTYWYFTRLKVSYNVNAHEVPNLPIYNLLKHF